MSALLTLLVDATLGEPPARAHPVVWMGHYLRLARKRWRARTPAGQLVEGGAWWLLGLALSYAFGRGLDALLSRFPRVSRVLLTALLLKPAFSARGLLRAVREVETPLAAGNLVEARRMLAWHLVSRDTRDLRADEVAGAAIESLFENLSDSVVGPLLAYRAGGLGLAYAYRFANTADATWGYRTPELEYAGKIAARADDAANLIPSRVTALLTVLAAAFAHANVKNACQTWRMDAARTPSPNAGHPMSAAAGALGVRLDKRGTYTLNAQGRSPNARDIHHATRLARFTLVVTAALLALSARSTER